MLAPLLTACGTLPQPFLGRPGAMGARLAVPPPPILIVPPPADALLGNEAAALYAKDLAAALVADDVPSLSRPAAKYDWRLAVTASVSGGRVTPDYAIIGPGGKAYGRTAGAAISSAAWAEAAPKTLEASAQAAVPALVDQLRMVNAVVQESNPNSLENRPARVRIIGVSGAPGDGDESLTLNIKRDLPRLGIMLTALGHDADFTLSGIVKATPVKAKKLEVVELDWTVRDGQGRFIGKVSQLHELSRADMVPYWGDVAAAAAEQAAEGIKQVIANATPKRPGQKTPASATAAASPSR